jgi:hypothetical protein
VHASACTKKCRDRGTFDPQIKEFLRRGTDTGKKSAVTATGRRTFSGVQVSTDENQQKQACFSAFGG